MLLTRFLVARRLFLQAVQRHPFVFVYWVLPFNYQFVCLLFLWGGDPADPAQHPENYPLRPAGDDSDVSDVCGDAFCGVFCDAGGGGVFCDALDGTHLQDHHQQVFCHQVHHHAP